MKLTPKQAAFVREYLVDLNATQAALRAKYSTRTAPKIGSENLHKPGIRAAIDEAIAKRAAKVEVKSDDILRELLRIARVDIGDAYDDAGRLKDIHAIPEDTRRAIVGIDAEELYEWNENRREQIGTTRKVRFADKIRALEMLGKHLKLFTEKVEHEHKGTLTLEQLVAGSGPSQPTTSTPEKKP